MAKVPGDFESADPAVAAVTGEQKGGGGFGVLGICTTGHGVHGQSKTSRGVVGESETFFGVFGSSRDNVGVGALSHSGAHAAITGLNDANGVGIQGTADGNVGVIGESNTGRGVRGTSNTNMGVSGDSQLGQGVRGTSVRGRGTEGFSDLLEGVVGVSKQSTGVLGVSEGNGAGVVGQSNTGVGVHGKGGRLAGFFEGNVAVTRDITVTGDVILTGQDFAEEFTVGDVAVAPGMVVVLDNEGRLCPCSNDHDTRVAGIVSGAGGLKPAIVLGRHDAGAAVALMGKAWCHADAAPAPIRPGDLLTTSPTAGHAQRVTDAQRAMGAVIGKALTPLAEGAGLVLVLVGLR